LKPSFHKGSRRSVDHDRDQEEIFAVWFGRQRGSEKRWGSFWFEFAFSGHFRDGFGQIVAYLKK
jgi:hypothetical protein